MRCYFHSDFTFALCNFVNCLELGLIAFVFYEWSDLKIMLRLYSIVRLNLSSTIPIIINPKGHQQMMQVTSIIGPKEVKMKMMAARRSYG